MVILGSGLKEHVEKSWMHDGKKWEYFGIPKYMCKENYRIIEFKV